MEFLRETNYTGKVQAALFDFDGTISTLRCGWEQVMRPLMLEYIREEDKAGVDDYINESTGIQTIYQMQYLAEHSADGMPKDPWWYKDEYNRRLMQMVDVRKNELLSGSVPTENYLISGAVAFLEMLKEHGIQIFVASGTDHPDVLKEAEALGVRKYFDEIAGAPVREIGCSKEKVLKSLVQAHKLQGEQVVVIGDGKVEIALGRACGARTIGLATNEKARKGVDSIKRERLIRAGADCIEGDFLDMPALMAFLGL